ncbi:pathogen-associated molecular patterns-induced protein A70 [Fagus crenata]
MFEESSSFIPSIWASMYSWCTPTVLFVLLNIMIGTIAITSSRGNQQGQQQQQQQQQQQPKDQDYPQLARSPSMLKRLKSINFYNFRSQESTTTFEETPESDTHYAFKHTHQLQDQDHEQPQLARSPSLLQRLKSINLYNYLPHDSQTTTLHKTEESDTHYTFQQPHHEYDEEDYEEEEEDDDEQAQYEEENQEQEQEQGSGSSLDEIYNQLKGDHHHVSRTKSDTKPASGEVPTKLTRKMKKSASTKSPFLHFQEEDIVEIRRPATVREGKVGGVAEDEEVDAKADDFINKFKQQLKLQRLDSIMRYKDLIHRGAGK